MRLKNNIAILKEVTEKKEVNPKITEYLSF